MSLLSRLGQCDVTDQLLCEDCNRILLIEGVGIEGVVGGEKGRGRSIHKKVENLPDLLWVVIMSILQKRKLRLRRVGSLAPGLPAPISPD